MLHIFLTPFLASLISTYFLFAAETTEAEAAVKTMSPGRRKCLLTSETDVEDMYTMKLFHEYKKSSCLLECK